MYIFFILDIFIFPGQKQQQQKTSKLLCQKAGQKQDKNFFAATFY